MGDRSDLQCRRAAPRDPRAARGCPRAWSAPPDARQRVASLPRPAAGSPCRGTLAGWSRWTRKPFAVSAYTGRFRWVTVKLSRLGPDLAARLVRSAWERTAPRRLSNQKARRL